MAKDSNEMINKPRAELWSTRSSKSPVSSNIFLWVQGMPFTLDKKLLAAKSAKLSVLFRDKSDDEVCRFLKDIVTDLAVFELVARSCYGFEIRIRSENVVPLICLTYYLEMTDTHCADNLLGKALAFFEQSVLPCWNESVKALHIKQNVFEQAAELGLVKACIDSLIYKAVENPRLLGEPIKKSSNDGISEDGNVEYKPNVRRRLFMHDSESESLKTLSLPVYESIMEALKISKVPSEYVAGSLVQYIEKWVLTNSKEEVDTSPCMNKSQMEVIETVERLLPDKRGLLPSTLLFEFLRLAIELDTSSDCRSRFETRIGKQLEQATVEDLLIPSQGYSKEAQYDIETVRRILKHFYSHYNSPDVSGLIKVAELVEQFLAEIASDVDLRTDTFVLLAETSIAACSGMTRNSDGIYRAISIYLDNHKYLTESEKDEVCQVLDCHKLSAEACKHAARNERLPMRVVVQVLFAGQLKLRDVVMNDLQDTEGESSKEDIDEEGKERRDGDEESSFSCGGDEVRTEMEMMNNKVMKLEKECLLMKKAIETSLSSTMRNKKTSIWKVVKRKFGCIGSSHDLAFEAIRKQKKKKNYMLCSKSP